MPFQHTNNYGVKYKPNNIIVNATPTNGGYGNRVPRIDPSWSIVALQRVKSNSHYLERKKNEETNPVWWNEIADQYHKSSKKNAVISIMKNWNLKGYSQLGVGVSSIAMSVPTTIPNCKSLFKRLHDFVRTNQQPNVAFIPTNTEEQFINELQKRKRIVFRLSISPMNNPKWKEMQFLDMAIHSYLMKAACTKSSRQICGRPIRCIRDYIPDLLVSISLSSRVHLTLMDEAPGEPLGNYLDKHQASLDLFLAIHHAVLSLWAHGISHADLHLGNIYVNERMPKNFEITIIDFDRAIFLPENIRSRVLNTFNTSATWNAFIKSHVKNVTIRSKGLKRLQSEAHLIGQMFWTLLTDEDRQKVNQICKTTPDARSVSRTTTTRSSSSRTATQSSSSRTATRSSSLSSSSSALNIHPDVKRLRNQVNGYRNTVLGMRWAGALVGRQKKKKEIQRIYRYLLDLFFDRSSSTPPHSDQGKYDRYNFLFLKKLGLRPGNEWLEVRKILTALKNKITSNVWVRMRGAVDPEILTLIGIF